MRQISLILVAMVLLGCGSARQQELYQPITVGVLYFENTSESETLEPLTAGLTDMFISELGQSTQLQVVERERLDNVLEELKLNRSAMVDPNTAQRIGKLMGAQALFYGGYMELLGQLQLNGHLFRVETAELMASAGDKCNAADGEQVLKLVGRVSKDVRKQIAADYAALLADIHFSRGRDAETGGDTQRALLEYEKALTLDSKHATSKDAIRRLTHP